MIPATVVLASSPHLLLRMRLIVFIICAEGIDAGCREEPVMLRSFFGSVALRRANATVVLLPFANGRFPRNKGEALLLPVVFLFPVCPMLLVRRHRASAAAGVLAAGDTDAVRKRRHRG